LFASEYRPVGLVDPTIASPFPADRCGLVSPSKVSVPVRMSRSRRRNRDVSRGVGGSTECCLRRSIDPLGWSIPPLPRRFRRTAVVFPSTPAPVFLRIRVHPLVSFISPSERLPLVPARRPFDSRAPPLGFPFLFAAPTRGVHVRRASRSRLCSALDVSHVLDGLLLHAPRGLVSSHNHVQDSRSRGFPRCQADPPRRCAVPSCRYVTLPCLRIAPLAPGLVTPSPGR
jgi:hypothetical protein